MKKRMLALCTVLVMLLALFAGCNGAGDQGDGKKPSGNKENTPQLVVAINPVLLYEDEETTIAYNEINAAMKADNEASSLSAMGNASWHWVYADNGGWTKRAVYGLGRWVSGAGTAVKKTAAYTFDEAGGISLARYAGDSVALKTYGGEDLPQVGLLLSATAGREEALCYTVPRDGVLGIPAGTVTAVAEVGGVKTGFLAEDGTARSAGFRMMINQSQIFSGTLQNSVAAPDGQAVTQLSYPQMIRLKVKAGDVIFFCLKLEAEANRDADVTLPAYNPDKDWTTVQRSRQVLLEGNTSTGAADSDATNEDGSISIIRDYEAAFVVVRDPADTAVVKIAANMIERMTEATDAAFTVAKPDDPEVLNEIILGSYDKRPQSVALTEELCAARANNASDFLIRRVGTKIYITAANSDTLQTAVNYFLKTFVQDDSGRIPADYEYHCYLPHTVYWLAGENIGVYTIRTERYPSLLVQRAAENLQAMIVEKCGYRLPIVPMEDTGVHVANEIRIGAMNGTVKVTRTYDTRFTAKTESQYMQISPDGLLDCADSHYEAAFSGSDLIINGGTTYAVNAAVTAVQQQLVKAGRLDADYTLSGEYMSSYDYAGKKKYDTVDYALSDGYGLVYAEEFSYTGSAADIDAAIRSKWSISADTTAGPTKLASGEWDEQRRPGIYGENWWITQDATGNGYLQEITKKESYGYDAGRLVGEGKWGFRYGIWETRLVMATRNGACSSVWATSGGPAAYTSRNEIDVYENYGNETFFANMHSWDADGSNYFAFVGSGDMERVVVGPAAGEHFYDTFHHIAIEWDSTRIGFYFDGKQFVEVDISAPRYKALRNGTAIKLANGVGTKSYTGGKDPDKLMEDVSKFFEVQTVDYTRLFQTAKEGKNSVQSSQLYFAKKYGIIG